MFANLQKTLKTLLFSVLFFNMSLIKSFEKEMRNNDNPFLFYAQARKNRLRLNKKNDEEQRVWELLIQTMGF